MFSSVLWKIYEWNGLRKRKNINRAGLGFSVIIESASVFESVFIYWMVLISVLVNHNNTAVTHMWRRIWENSCFTLCWSLICSRLWSCTNQWHLSPPQRAWSAQSTIHQIFRLKRQVMECSFPYLRSLPLSGEEYGERIQSPHAPPNWPCSCRSPAPLLLWRAKPGLLLCAAL